MPDHMAVRRGGDALVHEAQTGVKADQTFLAGEHDTLASRDGGIENHTPKQMAGAATMLVHGRHVHAEDHLPIAMPVMHRRVVVHDVGEIRFVRRHTVDETDQRALFDGRGKADVVGVGADQQPKMIGIRGHARGEAFVARRLRRREAGRLHRLDSVQVLHRCMSNEHEHTFSQGLPNLHNSVYAGKEKPRSCDIVA